MKTLLMLNSGDGTGLNFTRCLSLAGGWRVVGVDSTLAEYHGSEADARHLIEWEDPNVLIESLRDLIDNLKPDLLYCADTSRELLVVSERRAELDVRMLLPSFKDHMRMEDKWTTWMALKAAGIAVPDTALATEPAVLKDMLGRHKNIWLRRVSGSAGAGSIATDSFAFACAWLDRESGWGEFTVAERLTSKTATLSALWFDGELIASQLRERLGWKYPALAASGVTGITAGQRTIWDPDLHALGLQCVKALVDVPHGAIGVDFTYDELGNPLPTEVQPARFYSSMFFLAKLGLNFPDLYCQVALGAPSTITLENPIRDEKYWIKNIDRLPELLNADQYYAR